MKRISSMFFTLAILASVTGEAIGQFTTNWQLSVATANAPDWLANDGNDRGFAFLNGRLYVAENATVRELDATNGSSLGFIDVTGISGGDRAVNELEVSDDGYLFACNLRSNTTTGPFKVYRWSTTAGSPSTVLEYTHVGSPIPRFGDKCTVVGSFDDGTAEIWVASATTGHGRVYIFRMSGGTFSTTPTVVTLSDVIGTTTAGSAQASPLPDGSFYYNAGGINVKKYSSSGTLLGAVPGAIVSTGSNAIKYLTTISGTDYIATFQTGATTTENVRVVAVPTANFANSTNFATSPSLRLAGGNANSNGTGDTAFRVNGDGSFTIYSLGTNNGISASTTTSTAFTYNYVATIRGNAGWRMMSAPFNNAPTSVFSGKAGIQGFANDGFARNFFTGHNGTTWTPVASDPAAAQPTTLASGRGFLLYVYDNNNVGSTAIGTGMKIVANGLEPNADVIVSVHADGTDKINLLGNPFSKAINVSSITANGDFLSTVLVWSDADNAWLASSDMLTLNGKIAPWQGFILGNTNATEITIPLSAKTTSGKFYKEPETEFTQLQFRLYSMDNGVKTLRDQAAIVQLRPDALIGWDRHDMSKMASLNPQSAMLYFIGEKEGSMVAKTQESRPYDFTRRFEIPFDVVSYGLGGDMRMDWPILHQLPAGVEARIFDKHTGLEVPLVAGESYDFSLDASMRFKSGGAEVTTTGPRFALIIEPSSSTSTENGKQTTDNFQLEQNYPNPFNPSTVVGYRLSVAGNARLTVYDLLGREVAVLVNGSMPAGAHSVTFDASTLASGVYVYKLEAGGQVMTRRMTLVK